MFWLDQLLSLSTTVYVLFFLGLAALVTWFPNSWVWKGVGLLIVTGVFAAPVVYGHLRERDRLAHNRMIAERFAQLCKENAGEKILKTVDGVDGFLIMRRRQPTKDLREYQDQYWMGDPYGHSDMEANNPEAVFLADRRGYDSPGNKISPIAGYDFIEIPPPLPLKDLPEYLRIEVVRRHTNEPGNRLTTKTEYVAKVRSQYGYDWEDISTAEDRKYWIAGGRMRIIDLKTKTVIAERTGYLIDREQGRSLPRALPWLLAQRNACPQFEDGHTKAKEFVARVLKPSREKNRE